MVRDSQGTLHLEFNHLRSLPFIAHGIFTRLCGQSGGPFASLNVGLSTGDDGEIVQKNRTMVSKALGGGTQVYLNQVHSDKVLVMKNNSPGNAMESPANLIADAVVTDIPDLALVIQVADCQAILLVDTVKEVVANIHSGWRGSVSNIIGRSVDSMQESFGSNPGDILAGIGPSLGPCCSEFVNYTREIPEHLWAYKDENDHFDFWKLSRDQLIKRWH